MFKRGLVRTIQCSQCFDSVAAHAMTSDPNIVEIDNSLYANPHNKGAMVNKLDFGILGALEVDVDFNVNILTGSSGEMMGGLGGGPDVAAGAEVSIVTLPVVRGRTPSIVKKVFTVCTPGETVAAVVTEASPSIPGTATTPGSGKTWKRATSSWSISRNCAVSRRTSPVCPSPSSARTRSSASWSSATARSSTSSARSSATSADPGAARPRR